VHTATDFSTNGDGDIASGDDNTVVERVDHEEGTLTEEVGTSGEEEDFGEFTASDSAVTGNLLLTWMRRKEAVLFALVGHHLFQKQYIVALQWLNELLASSPTDADLLSRVGYVQLQLGDLGGAQQTFSKVDALISDSVDEELLNLAGRNRGLLHFAEKQYSKAFNEFATVLSRSPCDTVSVNNKALCLMYQRELLGATSVLEDALQSSPRSTLSETMVLNLCSMYELASMNSVESKRSLSSWLLTHAPDDFDLSCTRL
jgi:tetratricopeptide (TPR) repeat protein